MSSSNPFRKEVVDRLGEATGLSAEEIDSLLAPPPKADLGDLAFPCFVLAKKAKKAPPAIAGELAESAFGSASERIASVKPTGPYVNFYFDRRAFAAWLLRTAMAKGEAFCRSDEGAGKLVAIDFSSPNVAKPFHVGHLRSTIIGGALYRIFAALGYQAHGINHLGDWGTQFGKLSVAIKRWGKPEDLDDILALNLLYVRYHEEEKKDPALTTEAREWFRRQEAGDKEALELWTRIRETTLAYIQNLYGRLGVRFDEYTGESFFNDKMEAVVDQAEKAGLTEISDGALIVNLAEHGIDTPALLRKADGSTLYITRDLAAAKHRHLSLDFHRLIYVVGQTQALHFQQLFKVLELLGDDWASKCCHVGFGNVKGISTRGGDAKDMSTRGGNVVYLEELLDEAKDRALKNIQENAERRPELEDEEAVAEAVGLAAIFFSDLGNRRIKDYTFDWDRAISFEGDTGPYLLNAHARIAGIIRKCGLEPASSADDIDFALLCEPEAYRLMSLVSGYVDTLRQAATDCEPSTVANYLLEVAKALHSSYMVLRVKGEAEALARARLALFLVVKQVLKSGLAVLGIPALETM